jgi:sterol 3beta-glucosyltransferase
MKMTLVTAGSRGDVQPYIALGKGLKEAGHDVTVLATDDFEDLTTEAGLTFHSTGVSVQAIMQNDEWQDRMESGNFLAIQMQMREELKRFASKMTPAMIDGCTGADLVIGGLGGIAGGFSVAEKLGIPIVEAHVLPIVPTGEFPSPITPGLRFGSLVNRLSFHVARQVMWHSFRVADVTTREHLNMESASFWGPYRSLNQRQIPALYGYSRHVLPRPADWSDRHHITGYWFLDAAGDWSPPDELLNFLEAGLPPVYIGFGSMRSENPKAAGRIALEALEKSGQRGVIASGWGGLTSDTLPDNVFAVGSLPHSWLFPQMAAVVHHGGAGTTAAGLRAGVPSILVPFMGDQPFWGKRVHEMGAGTEPIPRKQLTADNLADAITEAVSNRTMQQKAAALGQNIEREDGVSQAVQLIERENVLV